jgi:hypothetical protein
VFRQFDGSNPRPSLTDQAKVPDMKKKAYAEGLAVWQEDLALYLLTQKLPDLIFSKYMSKTTVAEMWAVLIAEFTHKLRKLMKSHLHSESMNMSYEKDGDLQTQFDRVRMQYVALLNVGVSVSKDDYRSLVINFVPDELSSFRLTQISASMKVLTMMRSSTGSNAEGDDESKLAAFALDAESLMQMAMEEWDRREAEWKSASGRQMGKMILPLGQFQLQMNLRQSQVGGSIGNVENWAFVGIVVART